MVVVLLLAFVGGLLTVLSPCILPVLPFVFARADRPFRSHGLPMLVGMALAFAGIASLAAVGGSWAVGVNASGRVAALALLAGFGATLLFPAIAERLSRPLVALGARLSDSPARGSLLSPVLLGVATGLLWTPCAGPILGLVLTGAALHGASADATLSLLAYAAGAATALAAALLVGTRLLAAIKSSLGAAAWLRRGAGAAVLLGVGTIALGVDARVLSRITFESTSRLETALVERSQAQPSQPSQAPAPVADPGILGALSGATEWINSPPLKANALRGKVVLVDFWTYSCINCLRTLPYVRSWADKYRDAGLVVIGVHAPEFAFEKQPEHVRRAVRDLGIGYPVAIDNGFSVWRGFRNNAWPAFYFIDAQGRLRHRVSGEGRYDQSERVIQELLAEAGRPVPAGEPVAPQGTGVQAQPAPWPALSGETYLGHERTQNFASLGGIARDRLKVYEPAASLRTNQWGLAGPWRVEGERAVLQRAEGRIALRFHARDLHLVLGPSEEGKPVRFRVLLDGRPPLQDHGSDVDAQGDGRVDGHRLYQLVRQQSGATPRLFEIEFLDPGVQAYAFTFG